MKALLDNGADYTASHGLTFGEPLTEEQIAALDKSIVIYVKQIYKGAEVYAPVVYLSASDKEKAVASGAMIAGGSVNVTTDTITNSGLIQSSSSLKVEGVNIVANGGGFASQGDLMLAASGNLELNAGKTLFNGAEVVVATDAVSAGGTAILKSDQDITLSGVGVKAGENLGLYGQNVNIGTAVATSSSGSQNVTGSRLEAGNIAQIKADENAVVTGSSVHAGDSLHVAADNGSLIVQSATANHIKANGTLSTQQQSNLSSGGSALLIAGEDIVVAGSNVHADKDIGLKADGSISVVATTNTDNTAIRGKNSYSNSRETTLTSSSLSANNNITLQAGTKDNAGNINIVASDIEAKEKTTLAATGNVNILAGEETSHFDGKGSSKSGGLFGSKKSSEMHRDETTLVGSNVSGGKGVDVISDGDTTISASNILAGDKDNTANVNINAGGNIIVASGLETSSFSSKQNSKGFLSSSSKNKNTYDETNVASTIAATGNVNMNAGEHIAVSGSNLIANKDINLSGSSVSVIGAQENHHLDEKKKQTGFGVGSGEGFYSIYGSQSKATNKDQATNVASNLSAGENVNITARDSDVNIVGSNIDAGNDINLNAARDVNITPGHEAYAESEEKKRSGFGVQLQHSNTGASVGIGFASATDKKNEDHSINSKPNLNAGNDININAGRDANLQAVNATAGRDVNIKAVNDVNLLAANDTSNYNEMHERLFVGVTASVSSNVASAAETLANSVDRVGKGSGAEGIANLAIAGANTYGALNNLKGAFDNINQLASGGNVNDVLQQGNLISGSITAGFSHSKSQSSSSSSTPVVTQINAGRAIDIEAVNGSINSQGAQISAGTDPLWQILGDKKAGDISLTAGKDINLTSAVGKQESDSKSNASGLQVGVSTSPVPVTGNGYYDKGKSQSDGTYNVNTHVNGTGNITLISKSNTNISGGTVTGNSIAADIGGSLNITSLVDTQNVNLSHTTITAGFGGNSANADYTKQKGSGNSQTIPEQSGLYAGDGGFDIKVNNNTNLTGGVISSTADADKNRLETGTLTWSDVATKSEWETSTKGFGATIGTGQQGAAGTGPLIKPTLKDGDKDTGSARPAVSEGQIIITKPDEQKQDIAELNRDTSNTNDTIDALPDLQKSLNEQLKTQQEWSQAAATMATEIGKFADDRYKKAPDNEKYLWKEGGPARAALHAIAGGLLGGVNGVDGAIKAAIGAGVSTIIAPYIKQVVDQAVAQSGLTGANAKRVSDALTSSIVLGLLSGSGSSDNTAYTSNEIKYNYLTADQLTELEAYYLCLYQQTQCSDSEKETLKKRVEELEAISGQQTKAMIAACYDGPSPQCLAMIEEAKNYIKWKRIYVPQGVMVDSVDTVTIRNFDKTAAGMFAPILDEMLVDAYSKGLYGDDALKYVNQSIIRYDSTVGLVGDVVIIGGSAIVIGSTCVASVGATCVLAVAAGAVAANDLIKNGQQLYTGEEALSLIEQGLMKTGMSQEDATKTLHLIETGVAIASVVDGGVVIISMVKSNKVIAITKPSFPNKNVANAVSNEGKLLDGAGDASKGSSAASTVAQDDLYVAGLNFDGTVVTTRNGERLLINQGRLPTCGPTSCQMVANTLGKEVDYTKLITNAKLTDDGVLLINLSKTMNNQKIDNTYRMLQTKEDLAKATAKGKPAIVQMSLNRGEHAVVVDGITMRQGQPVVAIRDPAGGRQYFTPLDEFKAQFSGTVIYPK